jgi:hypothetical protein
MMEMDLVAGSPKDEDVYRHGQLSDLLDTFDLIVDETRHHETLLLGHESKQRLLGKFVR